MQVKRFFAADMRQAMKLVRDELGADASIIANRRVAGGVELTAALDYQIPAAPARQPNPARVARLLNSTTIRPRPNCAHKLRTRSPIGISCHFKVALPLDWLRSTLALDRHRATGAQRRASRWPASARSASWSRCIRTPGWRNCAPRTRKNLPRCRPLACRARCTAQCCWTRKTACCAPPFYGTTPAAPSSAPR